jgi:hypothetical protein
MRQPDLPEGLEEVFNDVYRDKLVASLRKLRPPRRFLAKWLDNLRRLSVLLVLADDEDIAYVLSRLKQEPDKPKPESEPNPFLAQEPVF